MRIKVLFIVLVCSVSLFSQEKKVNISDHLEGLTRGFYAALNKGDSIGIANYFHSNCRIKHVGIDNVWDLSLGEFLAISPKFKSDYYSEEIIKLEVHTFGTGLSYVDIYFDFYMEGSYSHSGLDHFCWTFRNGEMRIESVYSTDFKENLPEEENAVFMDSLMNKWHTDVAIFDFDNYFGFMAKDFIFLGTDPNERWSKLEFKNYCKPHFDRKSTWDFKTNWRNWYFSEDHKTAWFEESLDTQMEECRGSGVLIKENGSWKIAHYNLAVVIENEKMKKFIRLRRK